MAKVYTIICVLALVQVYVCTSVRVLFKKYKLVNNTSFDLARTADRPH